MPQLNIPRRLAGVLRRFSVLKGDPRTCELIIQTTKAWSAMRAERSQGERPERPPGAAVLFPRSAIDPPLTAKEAISLLVALHDAVCQAEGRLEQWMVVAEPEPDSTNAVQYHTLLGMIPFQAAVTNIYEKLIRDRLDESDLDLFSRTITYAETEDIWSDLKKENRKRNLGKRGRPVLAGEEAKKHRRIIAAWDTGQYLTYKECADALGNGFSEGDVALAVDREKQRKRRKARRQGDL